jgi:hypothetical protein
MNSSSNKLISSSNSSFSSPSTSVTLNNNSSSLNNYNNISSSRIQSSLITSDDNLNYIVTRQNIYNHYDYTGILIILFLIMFGVYLVVVLNKIN